MSNTVYELFTEEVETAYAYANKKIINKFILINGFLIRFQFANETLVSTIMKPFQHVEVTAASFHDFTVKIWDQASTGTAIDYSLIANESYNGEEDYTLFFNDHNLHMQYHLLTSILTLVDFNKKQAFYCIDSPEKMPDYIKACPLRMFFHWFCIENDMTLVHSSAVAISDNGYLLVGRGGMGKSTLSFLAFHSHCQLLGDDYVIVDRSQPPKAFSLYNSVKLNYDIISKYPFLNNYFYREHSSNEKITIFADDVAGRKMNLSFPLTGIVVLNDKNDHLFGFYRADKISALSILGASTTYQLPGADKRLIKNIAELVSKLDVFAYQLSSSIDENVKALKAFIDPEPLISVVLPVFNGEKFIAAAIKSVLNQSFHNIELLVIDDGSRDNTREIVSKFNDVRVHYIYQANKGPASARNNGIERARGDYIAFIDYDDTWYSDKLYKQLEYLKASPFLSAVYCKHNSLFDNPEKEYYWVRELEHQKRRPNETISSLFVKKALFDKIGKFVDSFKIAEDTDFYFRLIESNMKCEIMDDVLLDILNHDDNISQYIEQNRKYMFQVLASSIKRKKEYNNIKISVIITAYNSTNHLTECINSVFNQTFQPFEVIVIDDGSTNNTKELVFNHGDERIKYYYQQHQGISVARNAGILNSNGNYIAYIDHDDLWPENKLKLQIERLVLDNSVKAVFGMVSQFYSPEVDIEYRKKYICPHEPSSARHLGTLLIKKDDFYRVGIMDESIDVGEGLDWISRFDKLKLRYALIPEILLFRRIHYNNYGICFKNNRSDYGKVFAKIIKEKKNAKD